MTKKRTTSYKIILLVFFTGIALLYIHHLTRDIYSGDIGDLVTAAYVFGVPHPPGYPSFTLFGFILSHLPIPLPPVSKVGLISVFSSLTALFFLFKYSQIISKDFLISLLSTSILGFSYLFWFHSEIPEVFALNNAFIVLILYFSIRYYREKQVKYLFILSFISGLSLTHHHTILFILPAAFFLVTTHIKDILKNRRTIYFSVFFFILGLTPYLYVPLAAVGNPVVNWGNATTLNNVIGLILRRDYGQFAPQIINEVPIAYKGELLKIYFKTLFNQYSYLGCVFFLLGVVQFLKTDKKLGIALLFAFVFSGPFFVYYGANYYTTSASLGVIERFYTLSFVVFMFFTAPGLLLLKNALQSYWLLRKYSQIIILFFFILPLYMVAYNSEKTDLSKTHIGNNYALDILLPLPKNSVLFVTSGDTTVFNVWYARYVLGIRTDVDIINPPRVGNNLFLDNEMNTYYKKNPQTKINTVLAETISEIWKKRRIYTTSEQELVPKNSMLVPKGLVLEFTPKNNVPSVENYIKEIELNMRAYHETRLATLAESEKNLITTEIPMIYSNALVRVGNFLLSQYKNSKSAQHYFEKAIWFNPENSGAHAGLALAEFENNTPSSCKNAIHHMKQAIEYYFIFKKYYTKLYLFYKECHADSKTISDFKTLYYSMFKTAIEDENL